MIKTGTIGKRTTAYFASIPQQLRYNRWAACVLSMLAVLLVFSYLYIAWHPGYAWRWMPQAALIIAYVLKLLWTGLELNNHSQAKVLLPNLGWATWLTLLRGILIGLLAGFLFQPWPVSADDFIWLAWMPGVIYILAAVLDYFDGYIARVTRYETRLGKWLDTKIDALGLLIAPLLAIGYKQLPLYYISVGAAYYLFTFGIWFRKKKGKHIIELRPHPAKRIIAGFQMGLVGIALLPVFSPPATTIAAFIFMIPLLAGFLRDWLVICGYLKTNSFQRTSWEPNLQLLCTNFLPVFLRLIIVITGISLIQSPKLNSTLNMENLTNHFLNFSNDPIAFWSLMLTTAILMLALGIMGRIAALVTSVSIAYLLNSQEPAFEFMLLFSCAVTLMLTGSGFLSIWQPEDKILLQKQIR